MKTRSSRVLVVVQVGELHEHGDPRRMGKVQRLMQEERNKKEEKTRNVGCKIQEQR
jgi:hypothetical protein